MNIAQQLTHHSVVDSVQVAIAAALPGSAIVLTIRLRDMLKLACDYYEDIECLAYRHKVTLLYEDR